MNVYNIASSANSATASDTTAARVPKQTLGQEEFLELLATQLAHQDPLKPMEDTEFIAQMASFTSLENSTQLLTQFERLAEQQEISSAQNLLGRTVTLTDPNNDADTITGLVTAVDSKDEGIFITVNGSDYDVGTVRRVELIESTDAQANN